MIYLVITDIFQCPARLKRFEHFPKESAWKSNEIFHIIFKGIYYGYNSNLNMEYLPIYVPDKRLRCHVEVFYFPKNIKTDLMSITMFAESIRVTTVNAGRRISKPNRK